MIRMGMILAAGFALAGCQTQAAGWAKPGASTAQVERDFKECTYEADKATPTSAIRDPIASGVSEGMRVNSLRKQCLELRGYQPTG